MTDIDKKPDANASQSAKDSQANPDGNDNKAAADATDTKDTSKAPADDKKKDGDTITPEAFKKLQDQMTSMTTELREVKGDKGRVEKELNEIKQKDLSAEEKAKLREKDLDDKHARLDRRDAFQEEGLDLKTWETILKAETPSEQARLIRESNESIATKARTAELKRIETEASNNSKPDSSSSNAKKKSTDPYAATTTDVFGKKK